MKTVLVTGGAGFIGSHVVERLLGAGYRVVNLDLLTYAGSLSNLEGAARHASYTFVKGNIGDGKLVSDLLARHDVSVVLNIAAETHVDRSIDDAAAFIDTNITGVFRLLESSLAHWRRLSVERRRGFRFIQMSTDEVYGSIDEGQFTETSNYAPNSPYAASKAAGDHMTRAYGVTYGLPVIIAHASNTYGPRQHPEKLIPHMIMCALDQKPLPVYGEGRNVRDWLFVKDLAEGLRHVVASGVAGEVYNFSGSSERQNIETVRMICACLDRLKPGAASYAERISFVTDRPGHDLRYAMSADKARDCFGWQTDTKFEDGLIETVSWYLSHRNWCEDVLQKGYSVSRIGLGA